MGTDYKSTLNLPTTEFPMRAGLAEREPSMIERWESQDIYGQMVARRAGAPRFILHDGPPYANGSIHHGHILNKTLKDFVVKYQNMAGQLCEFVPGWDCHGLPIEHQVDKELGPKKREMSKVAIRRACRDYAERFVHIQRDEFRRTMVFADWQNPYKTMSYAYEAATVRELGRFFERGLVYRGLKPVHWDWAAQSALAEAEVEYSAHTTEHVYVKFPFAELPAGLVPAAQGLPVFVVIWTTTPWTLPANLAIALNPELDYQLVRVGNEVLVVADGLRESVFKACGIEGEVLATFAGRELVGELGTSRGLKARHPWLERDSVLLPADYVTLDQGTGCVHTAPGHGQEDFLLGQQHGLEVLNPVDETGRYRAHDLPEFAGEHVFQANPKIAQKLADLGLLLNRPGDRMTIERYPHGWRSKKPVIFRATTQWFVAMEPENAGNPGGYELRKAALEEVDKVQWVPRWGKDRIEGMLQSRPDWCISRQRSWGVPITVMFCRDCDQALISKAIADHVADLVEEHGADVWFEREPHELVPAGTTCPRCSGTSFRKEEDILDVWFDSGVSWAAVLDHTLGWGDQADLYLEGSDQHRGWFQSSLLCGLASRGHSPFKTCLTHGFVTDEEGHKYSKSSKNFEPPARMIQESGAEILRLWVAAVDYKGDITLSPEIIRRVTDAYRKIRNTFRFLLSNLADFDPSQALPLEELQELDRWVLHRAGELVERIRQGYEEYQFHAIYHGMVQFCTVDLSSIYMDITKDRMYCEAPGSRERLSGQTAYWLVLRAMASALAPVLSFTAEEVWEHLPRLSGDPASVFLTNFPAEALGWKNEELAGRWNALLETRTDVQRALEEVRGSKADKKPGQIGSSQEAHLTLTASGTTFELLKRHRDALATVYIVSAVDVVEGPVAEGKILEAHVVPASGHKCPRCWNYFAPAQAEAPVDETCPRCTAVLQTLTSTR